MYRPVCACTPWLPRWARAALLSLFALLLVTAAFAKAPATAGPAKAFLVLGDWGRDGAPYQVAVAKVMASVADTLHPDFVLTTGDNIYPSGVKGVDDPKWQDSFEGVYTAPSLQIPWYATLGNHDYRKNWRAQIRYSDLSERWRMPAPYYTFTRTVNDSTTLQVFVIDTNPFPFLYNLEPWYCHLWFKGTGKQMAWLRNALSYSTADWKVVVGHHPIYSMGKRHGDTGSVKKKVDPLLHQYGVQAYFNGHDHNLQHQDPPDGSVQYFTSGAGSETREVGQVAYTRFASDHPGFLAVRLDHNHMTVQAIDTTGKVLYSTVVGRDGRVVE